MPDPTMPRMGEEEWERELAQWEDHGCAGVCDFCADAANVLIAEAKRAREAEERLTRVIGEIEKWVRGLIAYKPREVAKDDFAYDRLLNEVKRAAKQMKRLTAGALKASVR